MSDWNFAPHAPAREAMRSRLLWRAGLLMLCAVSGAGAVMVPACWAQRDVENLQLQWQAAQAEEVRVQQALQAAQAQRAQRQPLAAAHHYAQALRLRGQYLHSVTAALAGQWPEAVQIEEFRLQGDALQLKGSTASSRELAKGLQGLSTMSAWQQAPSVQSLERLPAGPTGLKFVAQARWPAIDIPAEAIERPRSEQSATSKPVPASASRSAKE